MSLLQNPAFYVLIAAILIIGIVFFFLLKSADKKLHEINKAKYKRRKP